MQDFKLEPTVMFTLLSAIATHCGAQRGDTVTYTLTFRCSDDSVFYILDQRAAMNPAQERKG